jgi:hypothetical protein
MLGFPGAPDLGQQRRLLAAAASAYGLFAPATLLDGAAAAQDAQRRVFEAARAAGDPRYLRLIEMGALETIDGARRWLADHGGRLLR